MRSKGKKGKGKQGKGKGKMTGHGDTMTDHGITALEERVKELSYGLAGQELFSMPVLLMLSLSSWLLLLMYVCLL